MIRALFAAALLLSTPKAQAATWDEPTDFLVERAGPGSGLAPRTAMGIVLPTWQKLPLYEAYRLMALGAARVDAEAREAPRGEEADAVAAWLQAREAVAKEPPATPPGLERKYAADIMGSFVNCAPGAFRLATETLDGLRRRKGVAAKDITGWVVAQDAVFAGCTRAPGEAGPELPALTPKAPPYLRQLHDYQSAAAAFYAGDLAAARERFETIGRTRGHPLRGWAAVAALRASLRDASLDLRFEREWQATKDAPQAERDERLHSAAVAVHEHNAEALARVEEGARRILADPELEAVHGATRALLDQATRMLDPWRAFQQLTERLARLEENPYPGEVLYRWHLAGEAIEGQRRDLAPLRAQFTFLDWIATIQGCHDNPASPNHTGKCADEHRHALERWRSGQERSWLVATLVTAERADAEEEDVLRAAREAPAEAPERLTLGYHAARLLRLAGRADEARELVTATLRGSANAPGVDNLLLQERLALASTLAEVGRFAPRREVRPRSGVLLGADGDELLNRRLAAEDLLAMAAEADTTVGLRRQLVVAAWLRAGLVGKATVALEAARRVQREVPSLAKRAGDYLAAQTASQRNSLLVWTLLQYDVSPVVGWPARRWGELRSGRGGATGWCSFDPADFAKEQRIQRMLPPPPVPANAGAAEEQARLRRLGPWADVVAQYFLPAIRSPSVDLAARKQYLQIVEGVLAEGACPPPDAAALQAEVARLRETLR